MNLAVIAALDFPRQQFRAVFIGALIIVGVVTGWHVLAETHISVVLQLALFAIYVLAVAKSLYATTEVQEIIGRGLCALGTSGLLCSGLGYLHDANPLAASSLVQFTAAGAVSAILFTLGLWFTRPPTKQGADATSHAAAQAMALELPDFITFHQNNLVTSLAEVEQVRRKTERDYWKLSALGVPVSILTAIVLTMAGLAGRPPGWLYLIPGLALLICGIGAAVLRWKPLPERREALLRELGDHLDLVYHFGGGDDPDLRTATVFGSAAYAHLLNLLPAYRELKLGAAFRSSRGGKPFVFGEVTTIPPRKLGQNTARLSRNFLLLLVEFPHATNCRTIGFEMRGPFGHRGLYPGSILGHELGAGSSRPAPNSMIQAVKGVGKILLRPNLGDAPNDSLNLENAAFEDQFTIFTEDGIAARGQLTPGFMAVMMEIRQWLPPDEVLRFAFDGLQFVLSIEAPRPWLELDPPLTMALDNPRHTHALMERLQAIVHIVESVASNDPAAADAP